MTSIYIYIKFININFNVHLQRKKANYKIYNCFTCSDK